MKARTNKIIAVWIVALFWFGGQPAPAFSVFAQKAKGKTPVQTKKREVPKTQTPKDAEAWRKTVPQPAPERPLQMPAGREIKLDNGLAIVLIEDRRAPLVTFNLGVRVGDADDPPNQAGLAEATAALLTEGAAGRSSREINTEVETIGGQLAASSNDDYTEIYGSVISENADRLLEIFSDVVLRPDFPEPEVALYKKNRVQKLVVDRQDPAFLAGEQFYKAVYGAHPYGVSAPTSESIEALDRARIERFYKTSYQPAGAVLAVTGDFDAAKTEAKLRAAFDGWQSREVRAQTYPSITDVTQRRIYLIDRPNSEQADFYVGNLGVARADADFFPLLVANAILGDGTGSRLFLNIRERLGYSYDVSSSVSAPRLRGVFFGSSQARTTVAVPAIREMLAEFDRLRSQPVLETDLRNAKNYLTGLFSLSLATQGGVADRIVQARLLGLAPDYLERYRERVGAVTVAQVQEAAQRYIRTADAVVVVVGDAAKLRRGLAALGKVEIKTAGGK